MPVHIGTTEVDAIYVGSTEVDKVYVGSTEVFSAAPALPSTGMATRVGTATNFGVSESGPTGIEAIGSTLYMVGDDTNALYTVDTSTGAATRVGSGDDLGNQAGLAYIPGFNDQNGDPYLLAAQPSLGNLTFVNTSALLGGQHSSTRGPRGFGVGENSPRGLAAIGNTLYMVGQTNKVLYTVNTTTWRATRVGTAVNFGIPGVFVNVTPSGLASIGDTLYMVADTTVFDGVSVRQGDDLYTVNTTTGVATRVGDAADFGVGESSSTDLASIGNTLYMVGGNAVLYTLS